MTRQQALKLLYQYVKNSNSLKHMLATEAVMRALALRLATKFENELHQDYLQTDRDAWALAGLLHDLDMEIVDYQKEPQKQGEIGAQMLEKLGVAKIICDAARAHNEATGKSRDNLIEKAIYAADPLTGLIVASVLVLPSKKLLDLNYQSVLKRIKEKSFARGASREAIKSCSEFGLALDEFVSLGLKAMQEIADELEL